MSNDDLTSLKEQIYNKIEPRSGSGLSHDENAIILDRKKHNKTIDM